MCSPEVLKGCNADKPSDVFSLGVVMYELYTRKELFGGTKDSIQIANKIMYSGLRPCSDDEFKKLLESVKDEKEQKYLKLIKQCWEEDEDDRPSMDTIIRTLKVRI